MSYEQLANLWRVIAAVAGVVVIVAGLLTHTYSKKADAERSRLQSAKGAMTGTLVPAPEEKKKQPPFPYPEIEFGDSGAVLLWAGPQGQPVLAFANDSSLVVALDDAKHIRVSLAIRDRAGSMVAEIIRNEWKVRPAKAWDRNYNENSFEVRGDSGEIVLQVRLVGRRVQLQARLYDANGNGLGFGKGIGPDGKVGGILEPTGPNHPELKLEIEPMFLYPSDTHLGELKKA